MTETGFVNMTDTGFVDMTDTGFVDMPSFFKFYLLFKFCIYACGSV